MVNRENFFLFTPLLHEVATGGVSPSTVVEPIRGLLDCCLRELHVAEVDEINFDERVVTAGEAKLAYDYLVIALGATTNWYGVPGAEQHSFTLKTLADAVRLKNQFISQFEKAAAITDKSERKKLLRFVIVGGGPTGVELVTEMSDFFRGTFAKLYRHQQLADEVEIILVEAGETTLGKFGKKVGEASLRILANRQIDVKLKSNVARVSHQGVELDDGSAITSGTVIWVAGVKPNSFEVKGLVERDKRGRVLVNEMLQVPHYPEVFAIGDVALFRNQGADQPVPQLAQVASKQARGAAKNIARLISGQEARRFNYHHAGDLISLGHWMALAHIGGMFFTGRLAWWLWRTVYLFKLLSWHKKLKVAVDWAFDMFRPRDISKLS